MNRVRSMRPTSRNARASSFWRGSEASLRRIWLGATIPAAIVAMMRRMSGQLRSIDRTSVVEGQSVSVSVDLGGRRSIKKKIYLEDIISTTSNNNLTTNLREDML